MQIKKKLLELQNNIKRKVYDNEFSEYQHFQLNQNSTITLNAKWSAKQQNSAKMFSFMLSSFSTFTRSI